MAMILPDARPVLNITDGDFTSEMGGEIFGQQLAEAKELLRQAIRAVARVEMADSPAPFMGTAFAVGRNLYVTAGYVGEVIEQKLRQADSAATAWVDPSDAPTAHTRKLPIRKVHQVHPHWQVSFLEVEDGTEPVPFAPVEMRDEIEGRKICVIGYPAMDVRNDPKALQTVFGDIWGEKRLMLGMAMGTKVIGRENAMMVEHDASTSGGTGGAPIIDLLTGAVVGVQHSGRYLVGNWAVPAWELARDPQWSRLWNGGPPEPAASLRFRPPKRETTLTDILSFDDIIRLTEIVMASGVATEDDINALFAGLPTSFLANLPQAAKVGDRLRRALIQMNRERVAFSGRLPLYYVIKNATIRRSFDETYAKSLEPFLAILEKAQPSARGAASDD